MSARVCYALSCLERCRCYKQHRGWSRFYKQNIMLDTRRRFTWRRGAILYSEEEILISAISKQNVLLYFIKREKTPYIIYEWELMQCRFQSIMNSFMYLFLHPINQREHRIHAVYDRLAKSLNESSCECNHSSSQIAAGTRVPRQKHAH